MNTHGEYRQKYDKISNLTTFAPVSPDGTNFFEFFILKLARNHWEIAYRPIYTHNLVRSSTSGEICANFFLMNSCRNSFNTRPRLVVVNDYRPIVTVLYLVQSLEKVLLYQIWGKGNPHNHKIFHDGNLLSGIQGVKKTLPFAVLESDKFFICIWAYLHLYEHNSHKGIP